LWSIELLTKVVPRKYFLKILQPTFVNFSNFAALPEIEKEE
jgi:hypothetical protein